MNESNFIKRLNWIVTGDKYLTEKEVPLSNVRDASSFQSVLGNGAGAVAATGTLTTTDQPDDLDEITIGDATYIFDITTLNNLPYHVLIAASTTLTLDNLIAAINNTGTEGTDYGTLTPQNGQVSAAAGAGDTVDLTARVAGARGNEIRTTGGIGGGFGGQSWSEATFGADALTGGSGNPEDTLSLPTVVQDGLSFDDGDTALLQFTVPQDYAEGEDVMALRFHLRPTADSADTTDFGITTAFRRTRAGVAIVTTASTARAEAAIASTDQLAREFVADLSGRGLQPGDVVQVTLDVNNSGVTELILSGIDLIYGSCLAAYNDDDRFRALGTAEV